MSDTEKEREPQWCLVGTIVEEHSNGEGCAEVKRGTQHFSPLYPASLYP